MESWAFVITIILVISLASHMSQETLQACVLFHRVIIEANYPMDGCSWYYHAEVVINFHTIDWDSQIFPLIFSACQSQHEQDSFVWTADWHLGSLHGQYQSHKSSNCNFSTMENLFWKEWRRAVKISSLSFLITGFLYAEYRFIERWNVSECSFEVLDDW